MSADNQFMKDNLDNRLYRLAREFRKINGKNAYAEIILIGGASILINYGFRQSTRDMDAIITATASMKEAITKVGDELGLPYDWLNSDFKKTSSYSPKLLQYSKPYKTFCHSIDVRTVSGEYLVAMKLMSGRTYKNDLSDVIGILYEEQINGRTITLECIKTAVFNLYGCWEKLPRDSIDFITKILEEGNLKKAFEKHKASEASARDALIKFDKDYPKVLTEANANDIIKALKRKR